MNVVTYLPHGEILSVLSGNNESDLLRNISGDYIVTDDPVDAFDDYVHEGKIKHKGNQPTPTHYWDWSKLKWVSDNESLMAVVRERRNRLLVNTDYTQISDIPFGQAVKNQWRQYRQNLRDLPAQFPNAYLLEHITWPDPPE